MSASEDRDFARLSELAGQAAPSVSGGEHLSASELQRVRTGSEEEDLEHSYRHLATCSSCRARLVERPVLPGKVPSRLRNGAVAAAVVAAACFAGLYMASTRPTLPEQLAIQQLSRSTLMGSDVAPAAEGGNLELSFVAPSSLCAFLLPVGSDGTLLAPLHWFEHEGAKQTLQLAPRNFRAHQGSAEALIVFGSEAATAAVASAWQNHTPTAGNLTALQNQLAIWAAPQGARVQRIALSQPARDHD
ncbi:MAG TPA: hypothetical protein VFQ61_12270 [Polyangiaceae bacterium]|nr:hypothetical protein [Polyangiaceae bacterium]